MSDPVNARAIMNEARDSAEAREAAHVKWTSGAACTDTELLAAYRHALSVNAGAKRGDPRLGGPEIDEIVATRHRLICSPSEKETEWYRLDGQTWKIVQSITVLICEVLDELEIPTKATNSIVANVKTRLRGRCTIDNLQRAPSIIDFKARKATTFQEYNDPGTGLKPLGYPVACETCWYIVKDDGTTEKKTYSERMFLLNRLDVDPEKGTPTYTLNWLDERIGEDQRIAFLEWASYCMTPYNVMKRFHVWFGAGNTGKSTGVSLLQLILGSHNVGAQAAQNLDFTKHRFATSHLRGKLLNCSEEDPGYGNSFEKCIKSITGGGTVAWEVKSGPQGEERPTYRLMFTTNEPPKIVDNSDAFANRIIALAWSKPVAGKLKSIEAIARKFRKELPQILWYCLDLRKKLANDGFHIPDESKKLLRSILFESSEVGVWFTERLKYATSDAWISVKDLYEDYINWCTASGEKQASKTVFGKRLRRLPGHKEGLFQDKRKKRKGTTLSERGYDGLRFRTKPATGMVFGGE